jgi:glycerol-3-phosphate O-acyltransferase
VPGRAQRFVETIPTRRVVYLLDAASRFEQRLLESWIAAHPPPGSAPESIPIPSYRRARRRRLDPRLEACVAADDDPLLAPLRVAWLPPDRNGRRQLRLRELLTFGDPRDPPTWKQRWLAQRHPDRVSVIAGESAPVSELRERWRRNVTSETTGLAEFVVRQATLTLERAERRFRGNRYKVPRLVNEDILSRPPFRAGIGQLARTLGETDVRLYKRAAAYLREIAATHSPYMIDLTAHLTRLLYTQAYGERLHYDRRRLAEVYSLTQRYSVVFLPSHKSNLDHLVLQYMLHENGHPPNHTAGGINMNFFPVGPLVRRSGVFFIRRTFKDNPTYKFVLRHYIDYLIEKRFPLEWYIEGGRSRSGKLLPPRFGLIANVVDAYRRGKADDVYLIPVAIAYDQITDVQDYTAEQHGAAKQKEGFSWFVNVIRGLRRRLGDIHLEFGEPLALSKVMGPADPTAEPNDDEDALAIQKLAFEVSVRINRATLITPNSLVALALLGVGDRALTVGEVASVLQNIVHYVRLRQLPTTGNFDLDTTDGIRRHLESLVTSGVVTCFAEGPEAVYQVGADQHLAAAYYRNTIIHFFVNGAIAELALLAAAESGEPDLLAAFWDAAFRLRDLLKFEFFFADKDQFRRELDEEIRLHDAEWTTRPPAGAAALQALVRRFKPFSAHRILLPYLDAYRVVGDQLEREDVAVPVEAAPFLARCLALAQQYVRQRRIRTAESVSQVLFATALKLAANRGLLDPADPTLATRRRAFADELRQATRRAEAIDALAASRRAGVID